MSGGEIIPVAKAAGDIAKKALGEDDSVKKQLTKMAEDTPEMQAAAKLYARRMEIKQAVLLKLYQPLAKWAGASREYFEGEFAEDMAQKIEGIPDDHLTSPAPSVAVPAMQGLGYSLSEPDLKEMYLNLLATATDDRRQDEAHPAFAEVIKQLSAHEAELLNGVLRSSVVPIVVLKRNNPAGGYNVLRRNLIDLHNPATKDKVENPLASTWIDNWARLGLIDVDYAQHMTDATAYDWVRERPEFRTLNEAVPENPVVFDRGVIIPTDFGRRFAVAVGAVPRP